MYQGFLSFGGNELANAERTATYIRHAIPSFGLQELTTGCGDLASALGDQPYSSPMSDTAPWFSPYEEASADFYGLIPLAIEGLEDSTRTVPVTETTGDGAVVGMARNASRQIRVRALAAAADERAMDSGMAWLRNVLAGSDCEDGNCDGNDLDWLVDCPDPCDYSSAPDQILDFDTRRYGYDPSWPTGRLIDIMTEQGWTFNPEIDRTYGYSGYNFLTLSTIDGSRPWASYLMTDLVPGGVYRVNVGYVHMQSTHATVDIQVPGADGSGYGYRMKMPNRVAQKDVIEWTYPDGGFAVFEFTATASVHRLLVQANPVEGVAGGWGVVNFVGATVERMPHRTIALADPINPQSRPESGLAWSRTSAIPAGANFSYSAWGSEYAAYSLSSPTTTTVPVPAGGLRAARRVSGLVPGRRYRLMVWNGITRLGSGVSDPAAADVGIRAGVVGIGAGDAAALRNIAQGYEFWGWSRYEFQARAQEHSLYIETVNPTSLTAAYRTLTLGFGYVRVEEIVDAVVPQNPDPVSPLRRTLREVTCISGPTSLRDFPKSSGSIREVEFIFQAGDPRPVGEEIDVPALLGPGVIYIPEQACVNGEPRRRNLFTNPSFETSTAGVTVGGNTDLTGLFTLTNPVSPSASAGTRVLRLTCIATPPAGFNHQQVTTRIALAGLTPGSYYTLSMDAYTETFSSLPDFQGESSDSFEGSMSGLSYLTGEGYPRIDMIPFNKERWHFPFFQGQGDGTTATATIQWLPPRRVTGSTTPWEWRAGDYIDIDAVLVEETRVSQPYFDGSSPGAAWTGAADASVSTWAKPSGSLVLDPDCAPIPAPPRPPLIAVDCVAPADRWIRYVTDVKGMYLQKSPTGLPVVKVSAGTAAVRGARIRFQTNLLGLDWWKLNPCDFCGEFVVSYIPPNSTLTIDASLRRATLSVNNSEQSAMHLLYGSDGGPVVWPELKHGSDYLMYVDVDAGSSAPLTALDLSIIPAY